MLRTNGNDFNPWRILKENFSLLDFIDNILFTMGKVLLPLLELSKYRGTSFKLKAQQNRQSLLPSSFIICFWVSCFWVSCLAFVCLRDDWSIVSSKLFKKSFSQFGPFGSEFCVHNHTRPIWYVSLSWYPENKLKLFKAVTPRIRKFHKSYGLWRVR